MARLGHGQRGTPHTLALVEVPLIGRAELEHEGLRQEDLPQKQSGQKMPTGDMGMV